METTGSGPLVKLVDLHKSYLEGERTHVVLGGANAEIRAGERVAILGPSGSGKSTLLNLVSGIDPPDSGQVLIGGTDVSALSERERTLFRRHRIGFVFQLLNLIPTLTVLENLLLPLELTGAVGPGEEERVRHLLGEVGLMHRADAFPDRLSGGEQQRVAVTRALIHRPALVLADEPTGNLDEDTGHHVVDLLDGLVRTDGATLLLVTHARDLARRMDRVLRLTHGALVEGEA